MSETTTIAAPAAATEEVVLTLNVTTIDLADYEDGWDLFPFADDVLPYNALPFDEVPLEEFIQDPKPYRYENHLTRLIRRRIRQPRAKKSAQPTLRSLDLFVNLPLELIYTIFDLLHPIDLYNLSRTSKAFRSILTTRKSISPWAHSFEQEPSVPRPINGVPDFRWTHLLFGQYRCDRCNAYVLYTNISFAQRLCMTCEQGVLVPGHEWTNEHGFPWDLGQRAPKTSLATSRASWYGTVDTYRRQEAEEIAKELGRLRKEAEANPELEARVTEYVAERERIVQAHDERMSQHWANLGMLSNDVEVAHQERIAKVSAQVKKRFTAIGFKNSDYEECEWRFDLSGFECVKRIERLTNRAWNKLRPEIESFLVSQRSIRLQNEREQLVRTRKGVVETVYQKYREHCNPKSWVYHPPAYTVQTWEVFEWLINDPSDNPLEEEACAEGVQRLPALIEEWITKKIEELAKALPTEQLREDEGAPSTPGEKPPVPIKSLELATAIFQCRGSASSTTMAGRCLIGWEGSARHLRCGALKTAYDGKVHWCPRGYNAAKSLVEVCGLDLKKTTAEEMDRRADRFCCLLCPVEGGAPPADGEKVIRKGKDRRIRKAYDWRDAILHYLDSIVLGTHTEETLPSWMLLTPAAAADIRRQEGVDPAFHEASWCCAICPVHWHVSVKRAEAIQHVQEVHKIHKPIETEHFMYWVAGTRPAKKAGVFREDVEVKYRCMRCSKRNPKLWAWGGFKTHAKNIHHIDEVVEVEDWIEVERVLRRTPPLVEPVQEDAAADATAVGEAGAEITAAT